MSVTLILILTTCAISLWSLNNRSRVDALAHHPYLEERMNQKYRWITSGFVHNDAFHLFINMFVLFNFGEAVESFFTEILNGYAGKLMYLAFYIFMIVVANLPTFSKHKDNQYYRAVGASGAVAGVLFSFIVFRPLAILQLYFAIPIPAFLFGILYLWYESYAAKKFDDNIGHEAHFYGALAGLLFTIIMKPSLISSFIFQIQNALN